MQNLVSILPLNKLAISSLITPLSSILRLGFSWHLLISRRMFIYFIYRSVYFFLFSEILLVRAICSITWTLDLKAVVVTGIEKRRLMEELIVLIICGSLDTRIVMNAEIPENVLFLWMANCGSNMSVFLIRLISRSKYMISSFDPSR